MPKPSSIDRLPNEVREALQGWLRDPAITQTEATERTNALLDELQAQQPDEKLAERVSRQAVNRYDQRMRASCERLLQSRQATEVWADKLGSVPPGQVGHLVIEMLRTLAFDLTSRLQDRKLDEASLSGIAETAARIGFLTERLERSREITLRCDREIKRQAAAKAKHARRAAIKPEKLRQIIREAYGVP